MENILSKSYIHQYGKNILIDIIALLFIYFIPTLSHLTGLPFYLFEPMRLFLIIALLHSDKLNAYILAFTLPLFSFAISSHPVFLKAIIISVELICNVFLFHFFIKKRLSGYLSVFLSIILSKLLYYSLKFLSIKIMLFEGSIVSTSLLLQLIVAFILSLYAFIIFRRRNIRKNN